MIKWLRAVVRQWRIDQDKIDVTPPTPWQSIFMQSRVNGGDSIVQSSSTGWQWPKDTYLQRKLAQRRKS